MKYIKYNKVALALASFCILFSTSCSDEFLDRIPTNNYTADTYYTSDEAIIKAIEPLYNYAWHGYNERAILGIGSLCLLVE